MTFAPGTRLGSYEILNHAGSGGMGEVYKARDMRLNRTVAIKVLPEDFAADADRRQRFEREARVVASLSHPNICALHDVGSEPSTAGGPSRAYLVMEFLEGETLADRLVRGPLPLPDVIRYGADIATGLDAAHRQHIVHRDLKPGNIMITRSGVKLLDFGLAKTGDPLFDAADAHSTRALTNVTTAGAVMGTVPYMAPEQLEGRVADRCSDVFALGAVLHEMATGRRAFNGPSSAAVASAILTSDPPPITSSPGLERIVRTCLARDPERRWQSAHDVALQLEALRAGENVGVPVRTARAPYLPWVVATAALVVAAVVLAWSWRRPAVGGGATGSPGAAVVKFPLPPPSGGAFIQSVEWSPVAVSPDGQHIAYAARSADGRVRLWLRSLGAVEGRPIEGTEGGTSMFWSPDGKSVAFFAAAKLKRFELAGGAPVTICDVREGIGQTGTWGANGQIVFASVQGDALLSVSASGGNPAEIQKRNLAGGEGRLNWPTFLPDGRRLLYLRTALDGSASVMLLTLGGDSREVLNIKSNVQYVDPGYLLYASDATLVARRFDLSSGVVSGDPIVVGDRVNYFRTTGLAQFSASRTGVIAYQAHGDDSRLAMFDRTGRELAQVGASGGYQYIRLSADERTLVFTRNDPRTSTFDIWTRDLNRGSETRLTTDPSTEVMPQWGPHGTLIYSAVRGSAPRLFRRILATGKDEELSPEGVGMQSATSVSPDGASFLYSQRTDRGNYDLLVRRLSDNATLPFRTSDASETDARFSPDGKLVAFVTDETGRNEVVIAPFPSGAATSVSAAGGTTPRWSANGRELLYVSADGELMAVPVRPGQAAEIGNAVRLSGARARDGEWGEFEVMSDGRLLAAVRTRISSQQPLTVIVNWPASLSR